jgi:small-conductance mechanosensitive channel
MDVLRQLQRAVTWLPDWAVAIAVFAGAAGIAVVLHGAAMRALRRVVPAHRVFLQSLISASQGLIRFGLVVFACALVLPAVPLGWEARVGLAHGLVILLIVLVGWAATAAITLAADFYLRRANIDTQADTLGRKHLTQVRVLRRVAVTVVIIVTTAAALMTFDSVKQYGMSLIASAGAAGLVVGLAARPLLTNLFAGIQIAITQPIRIGDSVIVENEWGLIEEITGTYVVVKIWDLRRLVVPLSYFLEKPFQNWTLQSRELIGSVLLWVDYTTPVAALRTELEKIVKQSKLWDGKVVNMQVVDANERAVQLRALVSAPTAPAAWDLRCEVREKLIAFVQARHPAALPRQRAAVLELNGRGDRVGEAGAVVDGGSRA